VERPYFDRALAMQALTEVEADQCRRFGIKAPVRVLPNGVDLAAVDHRREPRDLRRQLGLPETSVVFLFLGRVFPKKGLGLLIKAFVRLLETGADASLVVAGHDGGSGYLRQLEWLAQLSGAAGRIRFVGEVTGEEKFETLRGADVFVLSSYSEGLPVAVLEAMACGRPVVITRNCNVPEVENCNAGWLVDASVESVFEGLEHAFSSRQERQRRGSNARRLVADRFTWAQIAAGSVELYSEGRVN
jgi:glycosyltransferase involved in cell wall biosynthesis